MTALNVGDRLAAYEIAGEVGRGAMGVVYRAHDTRLGRDVAIKGLPPAFAGDPDRLSRLQREARLISQVNHPNICTLFDVVEQDGAPFLIFELIDGQTLRQRLIRGPMSVREALRCASAVASALGAAHDKGIVHRDLKPSNVKITPSGVIKVLDFGVARFVRDPASPSDTPDLTLTLGGTREGAFVGTVAYVSPEQAMGDPVDARSDIWAFGCLVYEMLTAKRAFPGVAVADTLAAVMRGEPDWTALPAETPQPLRTLLRRCLEKDRARRLGNIGDASLEIEDLLSAPPETSTQLPPHTAAPPHGRRYRAIAVAAFLAGAIIASAAAWVALDQPPAQHEDGVPAASVGLVIHPEPAPAGPPPPAQPGTAPAAPPPPARTAVPAFVRLPEGLEWAPAIDDNVPNTVLAMSPNGALVAFTARQDDERTLWLHSLETGENWKLAGTEDAISPFWAPDSRAIGFFADRLLKRIDLNGLGTSTRVAARAGRPVVLCEVGSQRGGTWGPDGTIVFAPFPGGLKRIAAHGGAVTSLMPLERGEPHHVRPHFFHPTRRLLYRVSSDDGRRNAYYATSLDGRDRKLIAALDSGNVAYAQGHLLFMDEHALMAQPFDVDRLEVTGPARPIASGVLLSSGARPRFGVFSASQTGRLVYLSEGEAENGPLTVVSDWLATARAGVTTRLSARP